MESPNQKCALADGSEVEPSKPIGSLFPEDRYIPSDESFSTEKQSQFTRNQMMAALPGITDNLLEKFKALTG